MPPAATLLDPLALTLPRLPDACEGLRIVHLTDIHARADTRRIDRLIDRLASARLDLVLVTGDTQHRGADPAHALGVLDRLTARVRPTLGTFGVFGNHDGTAFRTAALDLPVHWLEDAAHVLRDKPIELLGLGGTADGAPPDAARLAQSLAEARAGLDQGNPRIRPLRLMLVHFPRHLTQGVDLGADLVFAGHTHGGQVRLPWGQALHADEDLPLHMGSGLLRCGQTLCVLSRGLGYSKVKLRIFCPPHAILATLRKGPMPGQPSDSIELVRHW